MSSSKSYSYDEAAIVQAIAKALEEFYRSLGEKLDTITIKKVMKRKNPYLYRAKAVQSASEIVDGVLGAFVSSSEETIFGNVFFEPLAIAASGGQKSVAEGIDLEIEDDAARTRTAIAVKSGTSVFNADSKKRQEQNFLAANKLARQAQEHLIPIVGYCYGRKKKNTSGRDWFFTELAGQEFWQEITGDPDFYLKIIHFMGRLPEEYIVDFEARYVRAKNRLLLEFTQNFCKEDGSIDWDKLVAFNSSAEPPKALKKAKKSSKSAR